MWSTTVRQFQETKCHNIAKNQICHRLFFIEYGHKINCKKVKIDSKLSFKIQILNRNFCKTETLYFKIKNGDRNPFWD